MRSPMLGHSFQRRVEIERLPAAARASANWAALASEASTMNSSTTGSGAAPVSSPSQPKNAAASSAEAPHWRHVPNAYWWNSVTPFGLEPAHVRLEALFEAPDRIVHRPAPEVVACELTGDIGEAVAVVPHPVELDQLDVGREVVPGVGEPAEEAVEVLGTELVIAPRCGNSRADAPRRRGTGARSCSHVLGAVGDPLVSGQEPRSTSTVSRRPQIELFADVLHEGAQTFISATSRP